MSGFAVIWKLDGGSVEETDLAAMMDRLSPRGNGVYQRLILANIGFGYVHGGQLPEKIFERKAEVESGSGIFVTGDIRLDNREELLVLVGRNSKAEDIRDSEVIRLCFERFGEDCFSKLIGDFAFVIWDSRKRRLHCVRDNMGVKHFYYFHKPGKLFALASEVKALLSLGEIPDEVDERAIGDYLIFNYQDKESTLYKGIKRLPANCRMTVDTEGVDIGQYWLPKQDALNGLRSPGDFEEAFRQLLVDAVRARTRSLKPVGSMLSGGLDSSAITCIAQTELVSSGRSAVRSYSAIFPEIAEQDARIDERAFIDKVIDHSVCDPVWVLADNVSPFKHMGTLLESTDHPVGAPNVFMDLAILDAANANGTGVLLSGFDGDSAVSYGYEGFEEMARKWQLIRLFRSARSLGKNMPNRHHEFRKLFWNRGLRYAVPGFVRSAWRLLNGIDLSPENKRELPSQLNFCFESLNRGFAQKHDLKARYFDLLDSNHPKRDRPELEFWDAVNNGMFAFALETFEKAAARFGVEQRYPFFDRRLIEFCAALPGWQRVQGGWTRSILRRSTHGILPEDVRWRRDKANIGISFKLNLHKFGTKQMREAIFDRSDVLEPYVDIDRLKKSYKRFISDPLSVEGEPLFINSCVNLSHWFRKTNGETPGKYSSAPMATTAGIAGPLTNECDHP